MSKICIICDENYYDDGTNKCEDCKNILKSECGSECKCSICNSIYKKEYYEYTNEAMDLFNINYCSECYIILDTITCPKSYDKLNEEIDQNYEVKIEYIKDSPYDDGYCSDPDLIGRSESYKTKLYPYYKKYPITNIDNNGKINDIYEGNILLYHKLNSFCSYNIGSDYDPIPRYDTAYYRIKSAYLVKKCKKCKKYKKMIIK